MALPERMNNPTTGRSVSIIGGGKVGLALCRYLASLAIPVDALIVAPGTAPDSLPELPPGLQIADTVVAIPSSTSHILICVPDDAISGVAETLAASGLALEGRFIAHTSGLRTSDELAALTGTGALCGSFHPAQSFHSTDVPASILTGIGCGIEGPEEFVSAALPFAELLRWKPMTIPKTHKPLYHASCVFAGNFIVALAEDAGAILKSAAESPVDVSYLLPMMQAVLQRLHDTPGKHAVTGPASRGDHETAARHIAMLGDVSDELQDVYAMWTKRILDITGADDATRTRMLDALIPPRND